MKKLLKFSMVGIELEGERMEQGLGNSDFHVWKGSAKVLIQLQ